MTTSGSLRLLGVDVGFSKSRKTTGVAWYDDSVNVTKCRSDQIADQIIETSFIADIAAFDGPLVQHKNCRAVERFFSSGSFSQRCKPGFSHFGTGMELRIATASALAGIAQRLAPPISPLPPGSLSTYSAFEAFPNAFLAVLLDDAAFLEMPSLKRGKKFDWLYDEAIARGKLESLLLHIGWGNQQVLSTIHNERDHEKRAALICLITAACISVQRYEAIGNLDDGWFILPPRALWAGWARKAAEDLRGRLYFSHLVGWRD